jgi:hypothetical protein
MKLSEKEKDAFEKLCAISEKDKKTVMDVLISILVMTTKADYNDESEITIPLLCNLKFDYKDELTSRGMLTKVLLEATPNQALINEFSAISEGETTPSEKYYNKRQFKLYKKSLGITDNNFDFKTEFPDYADEDEDEDFLL